LELGNKLLSSSIREGSDIYFVCEVDAAPPIKELTWLHNERPLNETIAFESGGGLIMSNNSLVLQRVKVSQRGHYACMASNSEGVAQSNWIELRVLREFRFSANQFACRRSSKPQLLRRNRSIT